MPRSDASLSGFSAPQGLFRPPRFISILLFCSAGITLPQSDASLSCSFAPQRLFRPPGFISILLFCSTGIISAVRIHLYLALFLHRDYFGRPDSSLSGFSVPQGLFRPSGFISIWLFCATEIISAARIHLYLALLLHRDYFGRPDSSLSGSFAPQGLLCPSLMHLYLAFLAYKWHTSFIFSAPFAIIPDITKTGNLENTRFPASGLPEVESEHPDRSRPGLYYTIPRIIAQELKRAPELYAPGLFACQSIGCRPASIRAAQVPTKGNTPARMQIRPSATISRITC